MEFSTTSSDQRRKSRSKRKKKVKYATSSAMLHKNIESSDSEDISSEMHTTARAVAAALKPVESNKVNIKLHVDFCNWEDHTKDKCWQDPDNPDHKLPPRLQDLLTAQEIKGQKLILMKTKVLTKAARSKLRGFTVEKITISPPADH